MLRMVDTPGKFEGELWVSEYVYRLVLGGFSDATEGSCDEYGVVYDLVREPLDVSDVLETGESLTDEEEKFLRRKAGAIVREDDQGFVTVEYYETQEELDEAWAEIMAKFEEEE